MILRDCPICSSNNITHWAKNLSDMRYQGLNKKYEYLKCNDCDALFTSELNKNLDVSLFYPNEYETHSLNIFDNSIKIGLRNFFRKVSLSYYGYLTKPSFKPFKHFFGSYVGWLNKPSKMIDIGCGGGYYLSKMKSLGVDVTGVDFDESVINGLSYKGYKVYKGGIDTAVKYIDSHSITMHHVLEHLIDPVLDIKNLYQHLSDSEELVIITPNTKSILFDNFNSMHWHMDAPRHTILFSTNTIVKLLNKSEIKNFEIFTSNRSFWGCAKNSHKYAYGTNFKKIDYLIYFFKWFKSFKNGNGDELIVIISK